MRAVRLCGAGDARGVASAVVRGVAVRRLSRGAGAAVAATAHATALQQHTPLSPHRAAVACAVAAARLRTAGEGHAMSCA